MGYNNIIVNAIDPSVYDSPKIINKISYAHGRRGIDTVRPIKNKSLVELTYNFLTSLKFLFLLASAISFQNGMAKHHFVKILFRWERVYLHAQTRVHVHLMALTKAPNK